MTTRREFVAAGATLTLTGCVGVGGTTPSKFDEAPVEGVAEAEWEAAPADSHGFRSSFMEEVLRAGTSTPGLRSFLVVRNGVLIGERYYLGASSSDLLPIRSVTKSVASILAGIALERGSLRGLDEPLARLLPESVARIPGSQLATLRLEDILQGRTGVVHDIDNSAVINSQDPVALALSLERTLPTPSGWTYNDAVVGLLSPILARAEGRDLAAMAARDLFGPLGIERYAWRRDRQGKSLSYAGLALRTRDLAKIAWTMANGGTWRGKQVVPRDWVTKSTKAYGPVEWQLPPIANLGYGYLWFSGLVSGRQAVWGWGYGGQFALFVPELRLVVATAAAPPFRENLTKQTNAIIALVAQLVEAAA